MRLTDKMTDRPAVPELLSPAGSPEALAAAIGAGADAVYLGLETFSNRMRARNFSPEELSRAATLCSLYGVKLYVTINTRVFDREWEEIERICSLDGINRADGFIVADAGVAALLRERVPHVPLHASTQITGVTAGDAKVLRKMGFSRMVCPRELSAEQIAALVRDAEIEIEMFVHGAHCVSFSGQCLMSYAMGGRSPNRGQCAQPCRMEYAVLGDGERIKGLPSHPLSLKDMALARHIPEIINLKVASLKIEGRQKSAEYVGGVTAIYRKLLDERRPATDGEMEALEALFSRSGFTDGYFVGDRSRMTGTRPDGEGDRPQTGKTGAEPDAKVRIKARAKIALGEPISLTLTDGEKTVSVASGEPDVAVSAPVDADTVISSLVRTGSTPFSLDPGDVELELGEGVWLTRARLNELRRLGTDALLAAHGGNKRPEVSAQPGSRKKKTVSPAQVGIKIGEFQNEKQATPKALSYFDRLFLPEGALFSLIRDLPERVLDRLGIALPPVTFSDEELDRLIAAAKGAGIKHALVNTLSQLDRAKGAGFEVTASLRFNVTSSRAAEEIYALGADRVIGSVELTLPALSRMTVPVGAVVYGRFPLMYTARCILTDKCPKNGRCAVGGSGSVVLRDRVGAEMPVISAPGCGSLIFNANPVWMADRLADLERAGILLRTYIFTTETPGQVDAAIAAYGDGSPPPDPSRIRRI